MGLESCACVAALACERPPRRVPEQLSFLSLIADATPGEPINPYEEDPEFDYYMRRFRKRRAKSLKASDMPKAACGTETRALLRTSTGWYLPPLFARVGSQGGAPEFAPADAATILDIAETMLNWRVRPGVKIFHDPNLMLRFLRMRWCGSAACVAMFCLDRKQRLLRFVEVARSSAIGLMSIRERCSGKRSSRTPSRYFAYAVIRSVTINPLCMTCRTHVA